MDQGDQRIRVTPSQLREAASFLGNRNGDIGTAVQALKAKIDETAAEWEGAAQSSFVEGFYEMYPLLNEKLPELIMGIMSQLNGAADAMIEADNAIARAMQG